MKTIIGGMVVEVKFNEVFVNGYMYGLRYKDETVEQHYERVCWNLRHC